MLKSTKDLRIDHPTQLPRRTKHMADHLRNGKRQVFNWFSLYNQKRWKDRIREETKIQHLTLVEINLCGQEVCKNCFRI